LPGPPSIFVAAPPVLAAAPPFDAVLPPFAAPPAPLPPDDDVAPPLPLELPPPACFTPESFEPAPVVLSEEHAARVVIEKRRAKRLGVFMIRSGYANLLLSTTRFAPPPSSFYDSEKRWEARPHALFFGPREFGESRDLPALRKHSEPKRASAQNPKSTCCFGVAGGFVGFAGLSGLSACFAGSAATGFAGA
jgi:hypothetical protein